VLLVGGVLLGAGRYIAHVDDALANSVANTRHINDLQNKYSADHATMRGMAGNLADVKKGVSDLNKKFDAYIARGK
jgi:hypothetical protein